MLAYKSFENAFGIIIDDVIYDFDDYVFFHFTDDKKHKAKIFYTRKGRAYFKAYNHRHYIDEFIKF